MAGSIKLTVEGLHDKIKELVKGKHYRVKIYAVRHMIEEGFSEKEMIDALLGDYSNKKVIDIVTAYIPQKPWWVTPTQRGRRL